jgi:hypothetical protein
MMRLISHALPLALFVVGINMAPARASFYDFNLLNGNDTYPFTPLNG